MDKKVLVVGNYSCANRGDLAILRGLLNIIKDEKKADIEILTEDVSSAELLLKEDYKIKHLNEYFARQTKFQRYFLRSCIMLNLFSLYNYFRRKNSDISDILFVGGSYFIDIYGYGKLDILARALLKTHRVHLLGHSMGPFSGYFYKRLSYKLFKQCKFIGIRDNISYEYITERLNMQKNIFVMPDTAFVYQLQRFNSTSLNVRKKKIAITVRELQPFDKVLGVSQSEYDLMFFNLVDYLLSKGYEIIVPSMCTPINSYHKDDKKIARMIFSKLLDKNITIIEDELNDIEISKIFSDCDFVIGTRLHSCILAMSIGTPAICVNYEHKSKGIYQKLGIENFSVDILDINNFKLINSIIEVIYSSNFKKKFIDTIEREKKELLEISEGLWA
jgi:colanic acid/amylovoran biosynthesis protein